MFCGNCGAKLNSGEKFCGSCGSKVNNENNQSEVSDANLIISRPGTVMGFAVNLHVTVNDQLYELNAGGKVSLKLPNGVYQVKYKIWCRREHEVTVTIEDNKVCSVIFEYDAIWGGFKVSKKSVL